MVLTMLCSKCAEDRPMEAFRGRGRQCRVCLAAASKAWRAQHPEKFRQSVAQYRARVPDDRKRRAPWNQANKDRIKRHGKAYAAKHPDAIRASRAAYRAAKKNATPVWADKSAIRAIYAEAVRLGMAVDHIHPLTHSKLCGLHVPWNLQLLSKSDNSRKGNRLDECLFRA